MKISCLAPLLFVGYQVCAPNAHAAILFSDNFDTVSSGASINGRTPDVNNVNANKWVAPTSNFLSNGSGGLNAIPSDARTASLDLGAGYLAANPGIYTLSLSITQPNINAQSWVALGFGQGNDVANNLVGNNGNPWLLFRLNGSVNVYGGPGVSEQLTNGGIAGAATVTATRGTAHVFSLILDTSLPNWTLNASIDSTPVDVNGSLAGLAYTFATNPTLSHYAAMSVGVNGASDTGTVDNFQVSFAAVPEPSTLLLVGSAFGVLAWRQQRRKPANLGK